MKTRVRATARSRMKRDLDAAVSRLSQLGGVAVVVDPSGTLGESSPLADEIDQIQLNASREIGFATRELVQERVKRLAAALDRLSRGQYGVCVECAEPIASARLAAVPEVQTCVRCQVSLEQYHRGHRSNQGLHGVPDDVDETRSHDEATTVHDRGAR